MFMLYKKHYQSNLERINKFHFMHFDFCARMAARTRTERDKEKQLDFLKISSKNNNTNQNKHDLIMKCNKSVVYL